tara:strand:- start:3446 stop:4336 length:891 start_codon:yes stop_codon:yes gene_type:complete
LIITGDWDGLAIGHPPSLPAYANEVYNTFSSDPLQQYHLLKSARMLFHEKQIITKAKLERADKLSDLEQAILKINYEDLYTDFSLSRAGCITPFEFLNNSLANYLYRKHRDNDIRDRSKLKGYQESFEIALLFGRKNLSAGHDLNEVIISAKELATKNYRQQVSDNTKNDKSESHAFNTINARVLEKIHQALEYNIQEEHRLYNLTEGAINLLTSSTVPEIAHPDFDSNIQNLFQHGYDMRNPYGSNLEGAWLMITNEGMLIHGSTQKQLLDIMLSGDFLEKNHIDVNFAADMSQG